MDRITITASELLDELARAMKGNEPEDARTLHELTADFTLSDKKMRAALHQFAGMGRLRVHSVTRPALDGRMARVPAYTILPAKTPPKGKR